MEVSISSELRQFVEHQVAVGAYSTASEVVGDALRLLQLHERERAELVGELRTKVAVGLEQLDRGEGIDANDAFAELRARNAQFLRGDSQG